MEYADAEGASPLTWAAASGHNQLAEFLLARGAPTESKCLLGRVNTTCC